MPGDPLIGQIVAERYQVLSVLGRGGMATVYLARHVMTDRLSALKVLRDTSAPEAVRARFFREAHALGRIDHPHVVGITDFGEWSGLVFLVMDYVQGAPLSGSLAMPWQRVAHLGRQLAAALGRIHQLGIVHRDVKPANVMLTRRGESEHAMLTDFGIADVHGAAPLTLTSQIVGTPGYIAPECLQGRDADASSDLYGLGVTLYEALTGHLPFDERSSTPLLMQVISSPPRPIDRRRVLLPEALAELVERLLAKEPWGRPRDAFWIEAELLRLVGRDDRLELSAELEPAPTVRGEALLGDTTTRPLAHFHPACAMALERVLEHGTPADAPALEDARRRVDALGVSTHVIGVEQERLSMLESHARTLRAAIGAALDGLGRDESIARERLDAATARRSAAAALDWRSDALGAEIACLRELSDDLGVERELLRAHLDARSTALEARIAEARRGLEARVVGLRADASTTWDALEAIARQLGLSGPLGARPASRRTPRLLACGGLDERPQDADQDHLAARPLRALADRGRRGRRRAHDLAVRAEEARPRGGTGEGREA